MAKEQTLDEIRERIRRLPPKDAAIVAARAAMRVLPVLAEIADVTPGSPWFVIDKKIKGPSREDSIRLIFHAFRACQWSAAVNATDDAAAYVTAGPAYAAVQVNADTLTVFAVSAIAAVNAYTAALAAATAAIYATALDASSADRADTTAKAADAAARSADISRLGGIGRFLSSLAVDLKEITYKYKADLSSLPLWSSATAMPEFFESYWDALKRLMRCLDPGFEYWIDWYEARLRGEPLVWEEIRDQVLLTDEQLKQEPEAINAYLLKLARTKKVVLAGTLKSSAKVLANLQVLRPLNRVRAILIGPGFAGKTSLLRALHGESVVEGKEDMTVGIEISESSFDSQKHHYQKDTAIPN